MKSLSESGRHENVLFLLDAVETKEYLIAVMELVDGDLHDMLGSVRGAHKIVDIFRQIVQGCAYIKQQGYYHCDLSLENVLIKLVPNYQVKWNSILQEETLGEILPDLALGKMTPEEFTAKEDESIAQFLEEQ